MPLFIWKDKYSVGVEILDLHHKKLFTIVNGLYDSCQDPEGFADATGRIDELLAYTEYHFAAEEELMAHNCYAGLKNHMRLHEIFIDRICRLKQSSFESNAELTKELIVFLGNWLLHHVIEEDKKVTLQN